MIVLALDTALDACSVALFDSGTGEALASESRPMRRGHAEALMPMVERVGAAGGGFASVDRVAVTAGPGSFTGLRVALAAARAMALGLDRPCVGVTTLAALAAPMIAGGEGTPVAVAIDARHDQIYFQLFGRHGRSVVEGRCLPLRDAVRLLGSGPISMAGSGAARLAQEAMAAGMTIARLDAVSAPDILYVARLGAVADVASSPPRPLYLKAADAVPQSQGRVAIR